MKRFLATLISISTLFIFTACSETSEVQTNILIERPEATTNLQTFEISPQDVNAKLASHENFHLIDVRTPEEIESEHIKGATDYINSVDIEAGLIAFEDFDKNEEILVYCRSGNRSGRVLKIMKELGFTNVKSIAGGINEWSSLGYNTCSEVDNTC
jgi:rhodanese-related sulfurtransferase